MGVKRRIKVSNIGDGISMVEAFAEFIADKEAENLSPKTIANYRQSYEYFKDFEFDGEDDIELALVQKVYVQQWVASMQKKKMRPSTINHYLRDMRSFLYWCMNEDREYLNPYKIALVKGQEELPKAFELEEVQTLLA